MVKSQYCDSSVLESNWFKWILASRIPSLEDFREAGILWTKPNTIVLNENGRKMKRGGKYLRDPYDSFKEHCLALPNPIFFKSVDSIPEKMGLMKLDNSEKPIELAAVSKELSISSVSIIHENLILNTKAFLVPTIKEEGFIKECPKNVAWHLMLHDINNICKGTTAKFYNNPEERSDLATEAIIQVIRKLEEGKLVYTPGRAPVFNLLTTTIIRCMYSIVNKKNRQRDNINKLLDSASSGSLPNFRSFKAATMKR